MRKLSFVFLVVFIVFRVFGHSQFINVEQRNTCKFLFEERSLKPIQHLDFGGSIADIYQGKNGVIEVDLLREGTVHLTLVNDQGTAVWKPTPYDSPNMLIMPTESLFAGTYSLVVRVNNEVEEFTITIEEIRAE